jgi:ankyrin repeat protein
VAAGTPVDDVDVDGSTALHDAAFCGRVDSVRSLREYVGDCVEGDVEVVATNHQRGS